MGDRDPMLQLASRLVPDDERHGIEALYNWCRRADEICDAPEPQRSATERIELLDGIEADLKRIRAGGRPTNNMDEQLLWTFEKWPSLDERPFCDMLAGMRTELVQSRFCSYDPELKHYAYCVAGTVGLMLLPVLGVTAPTEEVKACAIDLGIAVQLTNILRDVGYDAGLGRIYLPQEDLRHFGVEEADVLQRKITPGYPELVRFEVERAIGLLGQARTAVPSLPRRSQLVVLAVIELMRALLEEILARDCDNLTCKVKIGTFRKVSCVGRAILDWVMLGIPWSASV